LAPIDGEDGGDLRADGDVGLAVAEDGGR